MPQFRVVVPPNVREGQVVRAYVGGSYQGKSGGGGSGSGSTAPASNPAQHNNNHATVSVRVPKGAAPGDAFIFELSQDRLDEMLQRGSSSGERGGGGGGGSQSNYKGNKAPRTGSSSSPTSSSLTTEPAITDTRLVSYADPISDVVLGFLIGMSMVFGFFAGVLHVTDPL